MKVTEVGKKSSFNISALQTHASPSSSTSLTQFTQHREADRGRRWHLILSHVQGSRSAVFKCIQVKLDAMRLDVSVKPHMVYISVQVPYAIRAATTYA